MDYRDAVSSKAARHQHRGRSQCDSCHIAGQSAARTRIHT